MSGPNQPSTGGPRETDSFRVADEHGSVIVRKLVSQGERLVIEGDGDRVTLDALLLESLSWQSDREVLADVLRDASRLDADPLPASGGNPAEDAEFSISNEYSSAVVTKVTTDVGEGLRVHTPARGTDLTLGVPTLRALASLDDTFAFSEWFKTPFGPEDGPLEGPL